MALKSTRIVLSICLTGLVGISTVDNAAAGDWQLVKPKSCKTVMLKIKGKDRTYWKLTQEKPVVLKTVGPGELKVITRAVIPGDKGEQIYDFITYRDEKRYRTARATAVSSIAKNPGREKERLGESRSVVFNIPEGEHRFRFTLPKGSKHTVYARFLVSNGKTEDVTYVAYLPRSYTEEVRIAVKEREYIYYRCQVDHPVELEVIGPTRIKGIARLEFDHSMRGDRPYRLQVSEGDKVVQTYPFTARISGTATYTKSFNKILGKGDTFYIDVPPGKHRYRITTPDSGINVLLRFYLPQSDLGNETDTGVSARAGFILPLIKNLTG